MNGFRRSPTGRIAAGLLAAVGAAALTAGCGSSSSGTAQSPAATLKRAAYVSTAATGYKLAMTMDESVAGQKIAATADGSFSPGSHTGDMTTHMQLPIGGSGLGLGMNLALQMVIDHGTIYVKLPSALASRIPGGKPWISVNFAQLGKTAGLTGMGSLMNSGSTLNDPGQYLNFLRATTDGSVKDLGQATVDGVQTTHYRASVDFAKLPNAVPAADKQAVEKLIATMESKASITQMPVDAWIDSSHLIRRLHISYSASVAGQTVAIDLTENFSDYGSQPAPTIPSPDQTTNALSLMHGSLTTQSQTTQIG